MHKYGSLRDLSQNYALLELVEAEQKCTQSHQVKDPTSSASEILCGDSCDLSTADGSEIEDEHLNGMSWIDKLASVKDELDNLRGFDI